MVSVKGCDVACSNLLLENLEELYDAVKTAWKKMLMEIFLRGIFAESYLEKNYGVREVKS